MPEDTVRLRTRPTSGSVARGGGTGRAPSRTRRRRPAAGLLALAVVSIAAVGSWAWWNGSFASVAVREHCTATAAGRYAELAPDQGGNAAIIAAVGADLKLPARAATIAIATAIQESKLRNIDYGDRDSLGLFQQRPSQGWGTEKQIQDPVYAATAFYEVLATIEGYESMEITKVAQKVQRSAYPEAYADHEPEARIIASALSGNSPSGFSCVLRPSQAAAQNVAVGKLTGRAQALRTAARKEVGTKVKVSPVGSGGTTLRFTVAASTGDRAAWAMAHWAVARAAGLEVVRVEVGDRRWDRTKSPDGWTNRDGSAIPAQEVLVTVA